MKRICYFIYPLMIITSIIPWIPMSIKGILGLIFIIIASVRINLKAGFITATLLIILESIDFVLGVNVDYKHGMVAMILGSILYYLIAFYLGRFAEALKNTNNELRNEVERRKSVEKVLKKKLTLLQSLSDTIPSPIFFKDLNRKYIGCNRAFEAAIGISGIDLSGKTDHDITDKNLAVIYENKDKELLKSSGTQSYEETVIFADGSLRNIIFNKAIFIDENEVPAGIVGVMTDITDKVEAGKLKQSMNEILENDKKKTEFLANISHEIRTPLNVIFGSVQLMELHLRDKEYVDSREKFIKDAAAIKQNCYRLLRLVNNVADISKIDARAYSLHLRNCNIVNVIEEITLSVSDYTESKGINLVFDTDKEEKVMACDDEKIERIMLNLLSNAVKFTPKGGEIFVSLHDMGNNLCIRVEDNGIGIPENKQSLIFQRFCQIDEILTRQHEGSGIGLSLVKSLVEMHGGTITFESRAGEGTSFIINLPCKKIEEEDMQYNKNSQLSHIERIRVEFSDIYSTGVN